MNCPLCLHSEDPFERIEGRKNEFFWLCPVCSLLFRPLEDHISVSEEKKRYLTHNNSLENKGYVEFLLRPYELAAPYLVAGHKLLDYGCGYNPVFTKLMQERSHLCDYYDPIFFPEGIRQPTYFNIFCIETAEHFNDPLENFEKLDNHLESGGVLTVMTDMWEDQEQIPGWHYIKDNTHVSFYHFDTMKWIAGRFNWQILATDQNRIVVFQK